VSADILPESLDPAAQLPQFVPCHGARHVQQEDAGATRLWIADKFGIDEVFAEVLF
jgi:hypothetical protein